MLAYDRRAGFSLIELMIVVAIVGVLASIAMPQYQNYSTRARMSEGIQMLAAARIGVAEFLISQGRMPVSAAEAGLVALETELVERVSYALAGSVAILSVQVRATGSDEADGKSFSMEGRSQSGVLSWFCRPGDAAGAGSNAVPGHLLPGNCRGLGAETLRKAV